MQPQHVKDVLVGAIDKFEQQLLETKIERAMNQPLWDRQDREAGQTNNNPYGFTRADRDAAKKKRQESNLKVWLLQAGLKHVRETFEEELAYEAPVEEDAPEPEADAPINLSEKRSKRPHPSETPETAEA